LQLDKVYDPNAEEDDMMERFEEMNRMREHVMKEIDSNQDKLISLQEFIENTNKAEFNENEEWEVGWHFFFSHPFQRCIDTSDNR
jgi:hypothetical protein